MPDELTRLGVEVSVDTGPRAGRVLIEFPDEWRGIASLTPAAALELAERVREAALPLLPEPEPLRQRCMATARCGARCLGDLAHEGSHWTAAGWFRREGDVERAR